MSVVARELLGGLLIKDPVRRLGGGQDGATEIKNHAFFASINWKDLEEKKVPSIQQLLDYIGKS